MFRPALFATGASLAFRTTALSVRGTLGNTAPVSVATSATFARLMLPQHQQQQLLQQQVRHRSNRSRRGLYDGKDVRSGNNVSFSMRATKRKFKPNVFIKRLYSETLDDMLRFHVTTKALRSIDKAGGLDNYLLSNKRNITEGEGFAAKKKILNRIKNQKDIARKRAARESSESQTGEPAPVSAPEPEPAPAPVPSNNVTRESSESPTGEPAPVSAPEPEPAPASVPSNNVTAST
jgi:large subunit ribosomal protein L28